jgi:3D (Asp-Asp-Asp) domain-containing protein
LTASGQPVVHGVLGVTSAWYKIFEGYQIYIPGYGIGSVEDIGAGVSGQYWIDLGYSDSDWVNWSKTVTVYFLSPAPSGFSGNLP